LTRDGLFRHGNLTYSAASQSDLVVTLRGGMVVVRPATTHHEQLVSLTWTHQRLGGMRAWFVCACGRRAAKLYLKPGKPFACRVCCALGYESQAETPEKRRHRQALQRAQKLRMSLGAEPNLLEPLPPRQKGMRWAVYYRRLAALLEAEERVFAYHARPASGDAHQRRLKETRRRSVGRNVG
jgi:hypothetical protein